MKILGLQEEWELSVSCGYLGGLCCSQQVLDLSSSELECLLVPVGAA